MNFGNPASSAFINAVGGPVGTGIASAFRDPSPALSGLFGAGPVMIGNRVVDRVDQLGEQWINGVGSAANNLMGYLDPHINSAGAAAQSLLSKFRSGENGSIGSGMYAPSGSSATPIYYQAELAERYGMNRSTAYSEAMANTAYQRAVRDMQLAGLNPAVIYGAGRGSTAGSGMVFGSGGSGYGGSGKSDQEGNVPDAPGWVYYGAQVAANLIGSLASKNTMVGFALGQLAGTAVKAYNGL